MPRFCRRTEQRQETVHKVHGSAPAKVKRGLHRIEVGSTSWRPKLQTNDMWAYMSAVGGSVVQQ